jgi:hypothetical protein
LQSIKKIPLLVNMNHKSPMDRFIKNNEISEERVKEFLQIQEEHLEFWKLILKENVFNSLKCWVDKKNEELQSLMLGGEPFWITDKVVRGAMLQNFVLNFPNWEN